jgi:hypothetical protein
MHPVPVEQEAPPCEAAPDAGQGSSSRASGGPPLPNLHQLHWLLVDPFRKTEGLLFYSTSTYDGTHIPMEVMRGEDKNSSLTESSA